MKNPLKRNYRLTEKIMLILLLIALLGVLFRWNEVKKGFRQGWKQYSIENWFGK